MSQHNIVIVGGSVSGIQTAHYILKHIVPALPSPEKYRVYLINPSDTFYYFIASPRAIISDKLIDPSKVFINIPQFFAQYPSTNFTFVEASASGIDTDARTITYKSAQLPETTLPYHALVIATGASQSSPLFYPSPSVEASRLARKPFREALETAQSIVIAGGGPVGVETAAEIGEHLNGAAGFCASRPSNPKARVLLVTSSSKLLPVLREDVAKQAEVFLNRVGVDVQYNAQVVSATKSEQDGRTAVTLSTGEVVQADIYIPATGAKPNTSFMPASLVDDRGKVITNVTTLRVDKAGPRVYAMGDVSSASGGGFMYILGMLPVLVTNMKRDLVAYAAGKKAPDTGKDREFVADTRASQLVPVGRSKGVGQIMGWKLPSLMVWAIKGRDFMASRIEGNLNGSGFTKEFPWKFE